MIDVNIAFSRLLLKEAHALVKKHYPRINLQDDAWVYHFSAFGDHWEFHGPENFYWHGSADNAADARYRGWMAWLQSKGFSE